MTDPGDPTLVELLDLMGAGDAEDRAHAAFLLGMFSESASVDALGEALRDPVADVRALAAQSLALHGRTEYLPRLLELLAVDEGREGSPVTWAAAQLAHGAGEPLESKVFDELTRLAARGSDLVKRQVGLLQDKLVLPVDGLAPLRPEGKSGGAERLADLVPVEVSRRPGTCRAGV